MDSDTQAVIVRGPHPVERRAARCRPLQNLQDNGASNKIIMTLPELCQNLEDLDRVFVVASECYVTSSLVRHRYVLLELHHDQQLFWIRLDRLRAENGLARFLLEFSTSPARDTVQISKAKIELVQPGNKRENRQECDRLYGLRLGEMRHFFNVLVGNLVKYRLFDANCWCFATAIQQYLHVYARARFVRGTLARSWWAIRLRRQLQANTQQMYGFSLFCNMAEGLCDAVKEWSVNTSNRFSEWRNGRLGSTSYDELQYAVATATELASFLNQEDVTRDVQGARIEHSLQSISNTIFYARSTLGDFEDSRLREQDSVFLPIMIRFAQIESVNGAPHLLVSLVSLHVLQASHAPRIDEDNLGEALKILQSICDQHCCCLAELIEVADRCKEFLDLYEAYRESNGKVNRFMAEMFRVMCEKYPQYCVSHRIEAEWLVVDPEADLNAYANLLEILRNCKCGCGGRGDDGTLAEHLWKYGDILINASRHSQAVEIHEESLAINRTDFKFQRSSPSFSRHLRQRSAAIAMSDPERSWSLLQESIDVGRTIRAPNQNDALLLANSLKKMAMHSPRAHATTKERCTLLNEAIVLLGQITLTTMPELPTCEELSRMARYFDAFAKVLMKAGYSEASSCAYEGALRYRRFASGRDEAELGEWLGNLEELRQDQELYDEEELGLDGFSTLNEALFPPSRDDGESGEEDEADEGEEDRLLDVTGRLYDLLV